MMSTPRISQASSPPLQEPRRDAEHRADDKAMKTEMMPTWSETRAPKTIREKVSRPSSSVPIRLFQLGGRRRSLSCASGSYGAISGAASATTTVNSTTPPRPCRSDFASAAAASTRDEPGARPGRG